MLMVVVSNEVVWLQEVEKGFGRRWPVAYPEWYEQAQGSAILLLLAY